MDFYGARIYLSVAIFPSHLSLNEQKIDCILKLSLPLLEIVYMLARIVTHP